MEKDLQYICCWGELDKLKSYDKKKLSMESVDLAIKYMKHKLQEIEMWETEDQNQDPETLEGFRERSAAITGCIEYLSHLNLYERPYFCDHCDDCICDNDVRYNCDVCDDFDLCQSCFEKGGHDPNHHLTLIIIDDQEFSGGLSRN